ncbi:uncharacterized protein MAM_05233 [Metarhizium album ARSEF 1941]|uniref:Uncharacterized protein n=1 Tax=Metarhizium album (strain ARSEF 1941) TaxID=1081103 RepID=A0A0B2WTZ7_METAS|nr:uncharacterized protein MAM_05233 [Metarhizium album ARSEF 1941]KHN97124.1 hypothetical protein MAM_05233 [Metarhizium album ARSEF 1941]
MLTLLSQDRWIRMQGEVDHLKAVTSGKWLQDGTAWQSYVTAIATVVACLGAALASHVSQFGKILLICLLTGSSGLVAIAKTSTDVLQMHGFLVKVPRRDEYGRRLGVAHELIVKSGRSDWAVRIRKVLCRVTRELPRLSCAVWETRSLDLREDYLGTCVRLELNGPDVAALTRK